MEMGFEARGDHAAVVSLSGRLDLLTAADTKNRLQALVQEGWSKLVVDLQDVTFVDSSGLGAVIAALKAARIAGGDFRIARAGDQVRYILKVSTLEQVLPPFSTVEEALEGYE